MTTQYWLVKSEPGTYSWSDLVRDKRTDWTGVRNFAARALKRQGYEVLEATTGVEALEVVEREEGRIDIVVSDVVMPEMDGPTMLTELRKTNPDLRVIFVSGYPDDRFKSSLDPAQQFAFLPKPFTLPQLAAKVKEVLSGAPPARLSDSLNNTGT